MKEPLYDEIAVPDTGIVTAYLYLVYKLQLIPVELIDTIIIEEQKRMIQKYDGIFRAEY